MRIELANAHFANTSNFSSAQFSGSSTVDANIKLDREAATNPGTALLQLMRLALSSLGAPQPPPHPDELMHFEILRKVRLNPLWGTRYLYISYSHSLTTFQLASGRSAVSSEKAVESV